MPRRAALMLLVALSTGCGGGPSPPSQVERFLDSGGHFALTGRARIETNDLLQLLRRAPTFPVSAEGDLGSNELRGKGAALGISTRFTLAGDRLRLVLDLLRHASWTQARGGKAHLELTLSRQHVQKLVQGNVPLVVESVRLSAEVAYRPGVNRGRS